MESFYAGVHADDEVSVPSVELGVVEIPASLPDDLLLHDGLHLGVDGTRHTWLEILRETHRRGELFNLVFHPESFSVLRPAIEAVLIETGTLSPSVWIARLRDVETWWREKAEFAFEVDDQKIEFQCSDRATILTRGIDTAVPTRPWDGGYALLESRTLALDGPTRPLLGIAPETSQRAVDFLAEQGYLLDRSKHAADCGVMIDQSVVERARTAAGLVRYIESTTSPLVRYWRWPNAMRSALCVTGDLDALSLVDYSQRFVRLRASAVGAAVAVSVASQAA